MPIDWIKRGDLDPPRDRRILIYSPDYPEHSGMKYRFIDSVFFDKVSDATHWAYATPPLTEDPD